MRRQAIFTQPKTELFVILARNASVAVVFRRGPTKQVQLIKWNTATDTFEEGQWFVGRIYERRCDLSPDGKKLVYFAATYKPPFGSWTAVSPIPYFTALVLWPKGDGWGGGGLFDTPLTLSLNHREHEMKVTEQSHLPKNFKVCLFGDHPGWGEDNPIYHTRLIRDGWRIVQRGVSHENKFGSEIWFTYKPAMEYRKTIRHNYKKVMVDLSMQIKGIHERNGSWYVVEYELYDQENHSILGSQRLDWADWDRNGDLLFAKEGRLFRLKPHFGSKLVYDWSQAIELADFTKNRFSKKATPKEALQW